MERIKAYRKDLILILGLLIGAGLIAGAFALAKKPGAYVRVEQDGRMTALYRLDEDRREVFPSKDGQGENALVIEGGTVYMEAADCPDKLCVKQGAKKNVGDTIVCLPQRLVVTVISAEEAEGLMP